MRKQNHVGPETHDVVYAGRNPREVSGEVLGQAEHRHISPVPIRARKTGGQIAASGLDGGLPPNDLDANLPSRNFMGQEPRDVADHNIPSAFGCALWPFRLSKNPWRSPMSAEAKAKLAANFGPNIAPVPINAQKTGGQTTASGLDGGLPPNDPGDDFLPKKLTVNPEGTK